MAAVRTTKRRIAGSIAAATTLALAVGAGASLPAQAAPAPEGRVLQAGAEGAVPGSYIVTLKATAGFTASATQGTKLIRATAADCVHEAYLGMMRSWGLPDCPVVLDGHGADAADAAATVRAYHGAGVRVLARVPGGTRLDVTDPLLRGRTGASTAHQIMATARDLRRPVAWRAHGPGRPLRRSLVAAVRTAIPGAVRPPRRHSGELVLLGVGEQGRAWPAELWLTNMTDVPPGELHRLTRLVDRVDHDFRETAERVGIRDYTGRSFAGWHRHVTLASAAHTVVALSRAGDEVRSAC
ncbi:hypothetical protein SMICM17S_09443 [Streptomyces microflavus]